MIQKLALLRILGQQQRKLLVVVGFLTEPADNLFVTMSPRVELVKVDSRHALI